MPDGAVCPPVRRCRDGGFTLLEVLVTVVVLGLLLVTLSDGVRFGIRAWETDQRVAGQATGLGQMDRVLRQLVGSAVPGDPETTGPDTTGPDTTGDTFVGTAHALSFTTILPGDMGADSTHAADVTLEVMNGRLLLLWRPHYRYWAGRPPAPTAEMLLDHVARLDMRFWDRSSPGGGRWLSTWHAPVPPRLVRVRLVPKGGNTRDWPEMVIPTNAVVTGG